MRKHTPRHIPKYNVTYRPLTVGDLDDTDNFIIEGDVFKHQRDYVYIMALFDSINKETVDLQIKCPECGELIKFVLNRHHIMVDEYEEKLYGNEIKISVEPRRTGKEELPELIKFVVIDGEQILWDDCKESEKEAVLDSIDYPVFKSINSALDKPAIVANIPVRCSCGYEHIVALRGLEAFLKVVG